MQRVNGSWKNKIVASDLQEERDRCAFDQEEMRVMLHGGKEAWDIQRYFFDLQKKHPQLHNHHHFFEMTPEEKQTDLWKRMRFIQTHYPEIFVNTDTGRYPYFMWGHIFQGLVPGVGLHYTMFKMAVMNLSNEAQRNKWGPLINHHKILGCYAQTELGHGSNVAGLETTATLDKATDEFIIHSPTLTSTKYWPGDLGRNTTHAVVYARLKIENNDYGVQPFMVQLRDVDTFHYRKGIVTGDLGTKFGYTSKDNGWARFDQVRIPRDHMLMGMCEVTKEGEFSIIGDLRVLYSVMMNIRLMIVKDAAFFTFMALQIAVRYNAVRRQFKTYHGNK